MADGIDAFSEWSSQPFQPNHVSGNGDNAEVGERVAYALEYIAAQLGEISRKMDLIGANTGSATKDDFDRMNELLRKL